MRRILSCILLPAYVASCTSWHVEPVSPAQVVTQDQPPTIRVTLNDGSLLVLDSPVVLGDTLLGHARTESNAQRAVLLADISRVETPGKWDSVKTIGLTAGILLGLLGAMALAWHIGCQDKLCVGS